MSTRPRLYIVIPIAAALVALLTLMLICTIGLFIYACSKKSMLKEEPVGLLGKAAVLYGGNFRYIIQSFYEAHGPEEKLVETVTNQYSVKDSKCWYEPDSRHKTGVVLVQQLLNKGWIPAPRGARKVWTLVRLVIQRIWTGIQLPFSRATTARGRSKAQVIKQQS